MKIISFYNNERALIKKAASGNREAQQALYDSFAPKMLSVCRQYIKDVHYAEDVMIMGFVKVFKNLRSFRFEGSFEGWVRRIMIREAISYLRRKQFVVFDDEVFEKRQDVYVENAAELEVEHIQKMIDELPEGYKLVFVLFAVEGYKHSEIAEMLQVSESTSKSQLFKARRVLQEQINRLEVSGRRKSKQR
ncbi:MAG: RNA polymerase sigma factor [Flavobacteriaceae bacterium]